MSTRRPRQLVVFPHIDVEAPIDLKNYLLVSSRAIGQHIGAKYLPHVRSLTSLYRSLESEIKAVGVIVRKRKSNRLAELSDSEKDEVRRVIDALAFAAHGRRGTFGVVRDNFE